MKASRKKILICVLLIAALIAQGSAAVFAASPLPDANVTEPENPAPRASNTAELPRHYDLRDYGLVTSVKNQGVSFCDWPFACIASLESNYILQGYGTLEDTDFSEAQVPVCSLSRTRHGSRHTTPMC